MGQEIEKCTECGQLLAETHLPDSTTCVERSLLTDRVGVLSPNPSIAVTPGVSVRQVLRLMADQGIGCVIVADANRPVGVFSERDALKKLNTDAVVIGDRPVSEFMTADPQSVEVGAKVAFAVQRMDVGDYRHLPVVSDGGALTGVISVRDILRYLTERMP